jgi:hypothetical protein
MKSVEEFHVDINVQNMAKVNPNNYRTFFLQFLEDLLQIDF